MTSLLLVLILTGAPHNAPPQVPGSPGICRLEETTRGGEPTGVQGRALPSPDLILRLQESAARERSRAERAMMMLPEQQPAAQQLGPEPQFHLLTPNARSVPSPLAPVSGPRSGLTPKERRDLRVAMERFFRENAGKIIDARTGEELQPIVSETPAGQ